MKILRQSFTTFNNFAFNLTASQSYARSYNAVKGFLASENIPIPAYDAPDVTCCAGYTSVLGSEAILWVRPTIDRVDDQWWWQDTIVHELTHGLFRALDWICARPSETHEPSAYMMGALSAAWNALGFYELGLMTYAELEERAHRAGFSITDAAGLAFDSLALAHRPQ